MCIEAEVTGGDFDDEFYLHSLGEESGGRRPGRAGAEGYLISCFEPGESRLSPSFLSWASEPPLLDCTPSDPSLRATKRAPTSVLAE